MNTLSTSISLPKQTTLVRYVLFSTAFLLPLFISGPQLLTGTLVNAFLFLYVLRVGNSKYLPLIVLPSIGALLNGLIFGKFTVFLLYFLPFIWLANYVLIQAFQQSMKYTSFPIAVLISSMLKFATLFLVAYVLTHFQIVPLLFLQAMGLIQLSTALLGGCIAFVIHKFIARSI